MRCIASLVIIRSTRALLCLITHLCEICGLNGAVDKVTPTGSEDPLKVPCLDSYELVKERRFCGSNHGLPMGHFPVEGRRTIVSSGDRCQGNSWLEPSIPTWGAVKPPPVRQLTTVPHGLTHHIHCNLLSKECHLCYRAGALTSPEVEHPRQ